MGKVNRVIEQLMAHEKTPLVLTVVSCSGVVITGVMAAKAATKASRVLADLREKSPDGTLPPKVMLKKTIPIYAPVVGAGVATLLTIITMNRVSERNAALLSAGAALATNTLREYQQHVLEVVGAEKESKIRDRVAKATIARTANEPDDTFMFVGDGKVMCFDSLSGRYFQGDVEEIRKLENDLNKEILSSMSMPLNDFYVSLGLEPIALGEMLGFNVDNMIDLHFSGQLSPQQKPVVVLQYFHLPVPNFNKV